MLLGTGAASASASEAPAQNAIQSASVEADAIYGPFTSSLACHAYGIAGIATGSWSYYDCLQDTYGDYWLRTI